MQTGNMSSPPSGLAASAPSGRMLQVLSLLYVSLTHSGMRKLAAYACLAPLATYNVCAQDNLIHLA